MDIDRIVRNEERLDNISSNLNDLVKALNTFKTNKKELNYLNKYYGSNNWFKDKEAFENNEIPRIKAGVLSEDAVWILNENIDEFMQEMKEVAEEYLKNKKKDC